MATIKISNLDTFNLPELELMEELSDNSAIAVKGGRKKVIKRYWQHHKGLRRRCALVHYTGIDKYSTSCSPWIRNKSGSLSFA